MFKKWSKEQKFIAAIVLFICLLSGLSFLFFRIFSGEKREVKVLKNGKSLLECSLQKDQKFMIMDEEVKEVSFSEGLSSLSEEERDPAKHEVNFIEVKDGKVSCTESNCNNQICVHTPPISKKTADLPIVCFPHGLIIEIVHS